MDLGLSGRVAVVTGGSSGIGLATAEIFLADGARVAICGRDADRLSAAKARLSAIAPSNVYAARCDVLDAAAVRQFADDVREWGGGKLDILINNAGQGRISTFAETSDQHWRDELELKFFSQVFPIRTFLPLLRASDVPAIVGVNSLLALQPEPHMVCTSAARAGVQSLLKSLAVELAPDVRVNSVLLGLIDSGQWQRRFEQRPDRAQSRERWYGDLARSKHIPLGRLGAPMEPARAIAFLASPAASYITGASLEISGGLSRFI